MRQRMPRGFTLLELLLVVVLLGVVVAFAWPDFGSTVESERLRESATRMGTLTAMCRAEAMNEARRYRVRMRNDGSIRVEQQFDPIKAPHLWTRVRAPWARTEVLFDTVWIAEVQELPDGPAPIRIIDEHLEFPDMEYDLIPIDELEYEPVVEFEPDGSCNSLRWVLRDARGWGMLQTLDGRLGRVGTEAWDPIPADDVIRPDPVEEEEEEAYDLEDFE